jgi:DNA-binding transcriptional ArsR family regulator
MCDHAVTMPNDEPAARAFDALADPTRRLLVARLAASPGLTTGDLCGGVSGMTRWAVMKHLDVLRSAGLVTTLPESRRRRHYVDARPLRAAAAWLDEVTGTRESP